MGVIFYAAAPTLADEAERETVIAASGLLDARDDVALTALVREARRAFGTAMAAITILYQDWQYLIAADGLSSGVYSRRASFCGHTVAAENGLLVVRDTHDDERFAGNPNVVEGDAIRFYAGAALPLADGVTLGALCIFDPRPRENFGAGEEARLRVYATRASERIGELRAAITTAEEF